MYCRNLAVIGVTLALSACGSTGKSLTISTIPQGATVIEQGTGKRFVAPATIHYDMDKRFIDHEGCLRINSYAAHWASGAILYPETQLWRLCPGGPSHVMSLQRPSAPRIEVDLAVESTRISEIERQRRESEIRRLQGQQALGEGMQSLGKALGCSLAGGCRQNSSPPKVVILPAPSPYSIQAQPIPQKEPPPWARKRSPTDIGTVCDVDIYGRSYCGLRK